MERSYIEYNGKRFPVIYIPFSDVFGKECEENMWFDDQCFAPSSLWDEIEGDYYREVKEANDIDSQVYYYMDIDMENVTEEDLIRYIKEELDF